MRRLPVLGERALRYTWFITHSVKWYLKRGCQASGLRYFLSNVTLSGDHDQESGYMQTITSCDIDKHCQQLLSTLAQDVDVQVVSQTLTLPCRSSGLCMSKGR